VKAAVVRSFDRPLELEELPIPEPETGQVLVRVETCGLCHTDIHAARGEWPVKPSPPFIPGHEGVGVIERVGAGDVYGLEPGMRVALPWLGYACGVCRYCNSGRETLCLEQRNMGYALNGGFAEYAIGYARHVVLVPDGVSSADASPLTCAGVTTYKAVKESGARSSDIVAVYGAGGLGHLAVQYARITGATVIAVDINPARLESARAVGADYLVNPREEDPVAAIQKLGGADAAIVTAVFPEPFRQAYGSLARGGRLVAVGLPADNHLDIPIFETVLGGLDLRGSIVGTRRDLEEVFELHRRGLTKLEYEERRLDEVNTSIEQVLDGSAPAPRLVFRMAGGTTPASDGRVAAAAGS
jgi:propanol-preferring alcohol dehydrogenase